MTGDELLLKLGGIATPSPVFSKQLVDGGWLHCWAWCNCVVLACSAVYRCCGLCVQKPVDLAGLEITLNTVQLETCTAAIAFQGIFEAVRVLYRIEAKRSSHLHRASCVRFALDKSLSGP